MEETVPLPTVELDLPSAQNLGSMLAILQDLRFVEGCCSRLLTLMNGPEDERDAVLTDALWSAAVIAYARCFKDGKREHRLQNADITSLPLEGEVLEFHKLILMLRDKHIAHSVNPFEQVGVGAILSPDAGSVRQVEGIATLSMRHTSTDAQGVWQLLNLAKALADALVKRAKNQTAVVQAEAEDLDIEALYRLPRMRLTAPGSEAAARPRT
ncbi:hypothetical protein [Streptomyces sp. RKAG293]|uniref:hypothetical protein n=1 Tax=Streptomyces sp. RKAG293 TaxID=2893403 RepID=UPI002034367F|nr:hypothetical protein [Streptomyces sp. RKAG293]MCM2417667.1 hypothetical protein [Streptomyces sp. RKAG293]